MIKVRIDKKDLMSEDEICYLVNNIFNEFDEEKNDYLCGSGRELCDGIIYRIRERISGMIYLINENNIKKYMNINIIERFDGEDGEFYRIREDLN